MKTSNKECRRLVESCIPFQANNLSAGFVGDVYVVFSYNWFPIWACIDGVWYGHRQRYSTSTSKHVSQSMPAGEVLQYVEDYRALDAIISG